MRFPLPLLLPLSLCLSHCLFLSTSLSLSTPLSLHLSSPGLTILQSEIAAGFNIETGVPTQLGVSGGLTVGGVTGTATVYVDLTEGGAVVAGSLSTFSLVGLIEAVAHVTVPASLAKSVLQVELTGLDVELSTCTLPIIFNQQTFAPGFMFSVQVNRFL